MSGNLQALFDKAPRAIVHLRAQYRRKRLGLIFGSGASRDLHFPVWDDLVERIAKHKLVQAEQILQACEKAGNPASLITRSLSSITQMMFSQFRSKWITRKRIRRPLTIIEERNIQSDWIKLIHSQLYADVFNKDRRKSIEDHPYLGSFLQIVKESPLTVNYNFDDTLERLLVYSRTDVEANQTRGYEVVDKPNAQFHKASGVIYHPNGYLPQNFRDGASAQIVFADDAFQDQLISAANGRYVHLANHLFKNTCLLIGLSLDDSTLQSMLRQNAVNDPGNVHYIVHYEIEGSSLSEHLREIIFTANFESYRLYTLFLTGPEIADLAALIDMDEEKFELDFQDRQTKFIYYLVGSVGSGKSTAASKFSNLQTYDEWIDERKEKLALPESKVPDNEIDELDEWIVEQFRKKNFAVSRCAEGIHIIDRCPLDPLTFGHVSKRPVKAKKLKEHITCNGTLPLEAGHIIHLDSSLEDIRIRNSFKHKYWPDVEYERLLEAIDEIYGHLRKKSIVCTRGRIASDVAREVAEVIFTHKYEPVDLATELTKHIKAAKGAAV